MKVVRISAIFLMLMVLNVHQGSSFFSDLWKIAKTSYNVASKLAEGASAYDLLTDNTEEKLDTIYSSIKNIMRDQQLISQRLEANVQKMLQNLQKQLRQEIEFDRLRDRLTQDYIARVNNIFTAFYNAAERKYNDVTMCDLAIKTTSFGSHEIHDSLEKTVQLISHEGVSSYFSNFIDILVTQAQIQEVNRCGKGVSTQQEMYQFFQLLVVTEMKAFIVLSYAYTIKSKCLKVNFTNEIKGAQTDLENRVRQYMITIRKAMANVSTEIHRCEPLTYIRNENFFELERFYQLVVFAENETTTVSDCSGECSTFSDTPRPFASDIGGSPNLSPSHCKKCESAGYTQICYPLDSNHSHRYFGVITNLKSHPPNTYFGQLDECSKFGVGELEKKTYDSRVSGFFKCDICICTCMNYIKDVKYRYFISLNHQRADITKNEVVTGIRFNKMSHKIGQIIYPQIKVGKLSADGNVTDAVWKDHEHVDDLSTYLAIGDEEYQAYFFNLDDTYVPAGHVVTGVRFNVIVDYFRQRLPWYIKLHDEGKSVSLQLTMARLNYSTGEITKLTKGLDLADAQWNLGVKINEDESDIAKAFRREVDLEDMVVPIRSKNIKPLSTDHTYVRFTMSDKIKDFGQSTIPFFDLQPVETSPPAPLSGVGIFLKGERGFSGFLTFKILTLNMSNFLYTGTPNENDFTIPLPYNITENHPADHVDALKSKYLLPTS